MKARIISTLILWLVVVCTLVFLGATGAVLLLALFAFGTQKELYDILDKKGACANRPLGYACGALSVLGSHFLQNKSFGGFHFHGYEFLVLSCFLCAGLMIRKDAKSRNPLTVMATVFGVLYGPFLLQFLVLVVNLPAESLGPLADLKITKATTDAQGLALVLWTIATVKFTDVGALLVGRAFGKTPFAPTISPKKTWEGVAGGVIVSIGVAMLIRVGFKNSFPASFTVWEAALVAAPLSVGGVIGDLVESVFKRETGIKDSGSTIPGIGGVFDLTDSLLFTAPLAYTLLAWALG